MGRNVRYFVAANNAAYQALRACLDQANGLPCSDTVETLPATTHQSVSGSPLVAVYDDLVSEACVSLVSEITEQQFLSQLPPPPTVP